MSATTQADPVSELITEARAKYRRLVIDIARDGKQPAKREVLEILVATGRSSEELAADVATLQKRLEAAKQIEDAGGMNQQVAEARQALQQAEADYARFINETTRKTAALQQRVRQCYYAYEQLSAKQTRIRDQASALLTKTADPSIAEQIQALQHRSRQLGVMPNSKVGKGGLEAAGAKVRGFAERQQDPIEGMKWP